MSSLIGLRIIYALAVCYGVWAAVDLLLEAQRKYSVLAKDRRNGAALFLAHAHVRDAWQTLFVQVALLVILGLGAMIPVHDWHEEGGIYRLWITILHTMITLVFTWKSIRMQRDRQILADILDAQENK